MNRAKKIVAFVFGLGLIANSVLLGFQAWKIYESKSAEGISLIAFGGFVFFQLAGTVHGILQRDKSLSIGMGASMLSTLAIVILAIIYG